MASFIRSDLEFILQQIYIAEAHAIGTPLVEAVPNVEVPYGLRTVDGSGNNLLEGQGEFGAADNRFPRLTGPVFQDAESGANSLSQLILPGNVLLEGNLAAPVSAAAAIKTGHAFLDDIAHAAVPNAEGTYDAALLEAHYIAGDGARER